MGNNEHHDVYHVTPFSTYLKVYFALLGFTALTLIMAQPALAMGKLSLILAMAIATTKAVLVVWFFMHQSHEGKMNRTIFISGFVFLFIFWFFTFVDWATRNNLFENNAFNPKPVIEESATQK